MKVSVIVPVYNVESYLEKCLDSLVNQTLKEIEILVVNDGSPDNSQKIIDEYTKKYKNVKSFIKENGGLSDARNYGIKYATGEYLSFVDADDYVHKDMLQKMYQKAKKNNLDIVVCDFFNVYEDGREEYMHSNLHYHENDVNNYIISPPMAWSRLYRRDLFDGIEFKKGILYEDLELTPSLVAQTNKIAFLEEGLYYYLQRSGSIMKQKKFSSKLLDIFDVLESVTSKLDKTKYDQEIEYLYITHLLRTASLRFLEYKEGKEYYQKIRKIMKEKYPTFTKNFYFKKSSMKLKLICFFSYYGQTFLLKLVKKVSGK